MSSYEVREGVGGWISNAVTRNPEGLLLLAAGAALLLRSGRGQRRSYAETYPARAEGQQRCGAEAAVYSGPKTAAKSGPA